VEGDGGDGGAADGFRCIGGVFDGNVFRRLILSRGRPAGVETTRHELIDELVDTGLSAQMLGIGAQTTARSPPGDAKLFALLVSDEPMIGLTFFVAADVARNGLPDQCKSPGRPAHISSRFGSEE